MPESILERNWANGENLTREQMKFRLRAYRRRQDNLEEKLAKAHAEKAALEKEVARLRDQLGAKGRQAAAEAMGELLQRIGREIANAG